MRDEEAGEGETQSHLLPPERVILIPKSNHSRDGHAVLQPGAEVRCQITRRYHILLSK